MRDAGLCRGGWVRKMGVPGDLLKRVKKSAPLSLWLILVPMAALGPALMLMSRETGRDETLAERARQQEQALRAAAQAALELEAAPASPFVIRPHGTAALPGTNRK